MKSIIISAFLFAICIAVHAQDAVKAPAKKETQSASKSTAKPVPLPADGKDPVCFMPVKKGTLMTSSYKDKLYGFCSEHCKAMFVANPEEQLKPVGKAKKS